MLLFDSYANARNKLKLAEKLSDLNKVKYEILLIWCFERTFHIEIFLR
jgi:hypothetical protein